MLEKFTYIVTALCVVMFAPATLAHSGEHGADGVIQAVLHQLTAADHWLMVLVLCVFVGLFLSAARRS
jgi:hydrogenase/urease accessory protein HupE